VSGLWVGRVPGQRPDGAPPTIRATAKMTVLTNTPSVSVPGKK